MSSDDLLQQRTARGAFWATIEVWGVEILQFLVFAVLARVLGPGAYGIVGLAILPVLVVNVFVMQGGWIEFIVRNRGRVVEQVNTVFWVVVVLGLLLAAAVVASAPLMARAFETPELVVLVPWLAICPALMSLSVVPAALLQREINLAPFAIRSTLSVAVAGSIGIWLALSGYGVWSLIVYEITIPLVGATVLWTAVNWRPHARVSIKHFSEAIRFSSSVLGERVIALTETLGPRAAIGATHGAIAVGHWTLARKIFDLSADLMQRPALRVALPRFASAQQRPDQLTTLLTSAVELTALLAIPSYAILGVLGDDLVALLFGEAWRKAGQVLMILAALGLITPATQLSTVMLHAVGRAKLSLKLAVAGFICLVLLVIASTRWGVFGVALAFLVRGWIMLLVRLWAIRLTTHVRLRNLRAGIGPMLTAGVAMALTLFLFSAMFSARLGELQSLAIAVVPGTVVYGAVLWVLAKGQVLAAMTFVRAALETDTRGAL